MVRVFAPALHDITPRQGKSGDAPVHIEKPFSRDFSCGNAGAWPGHDRRCPERIPGGQLFFTGGTVLDLVQEQDY